MTLIQPKLPFKPQPKRSPEDFKRIKLDLDINFNELTPDLVGVELPFDLTELDAPLPIVSKPNLSYVEQFDNCLNSVLSAESHLVNVDLAIRFISLPEQAKELYLRLFNRKYGWISIKKLVNDRWTNDELLERILELDGFVESDIPTKELQLIATKADYESVCRHFGHAPGSLNKSQLREKIMEISTNEEFIDKLKSVIGPAVKLRKDVQETFFKFIICYERLTKWPTDEKFMTKSILSNLNEENQNKKNYMEINFTRCALIWPTKDDFEEYVGALKLDAICDSYLDQNTASGFQVVVEHASTIMNRWMQCTSQIDPHVTGIPWFSVFTAGWVYTRILHKSFNALFRLKRHQDCIELLKKLLDQRHYCLSKKGRWFDEYVRLLERYVDEKAARRACREALADKFVVTGHRNSIIKRLKRLCKKSNTHSCALWNIPDKKSIYARTIKGIRVNTETVKGPTIQPVKMLGENGDLISVEDFALEAYRKEGWKGHHSENSILLTLFGLLFWDILFDATIPGAFNSPYQDSPLDLYSEYFFETRRETIEQRLIEIKDGRAADIIVKVAREHRNKRTICVGVNWAKFKVSELVEIVLCIGGESLSKICGAFAKSFWAHLGGVPDLCLWNPLNRRFKLVEVKSEKDRLSSKQVEWLQHLSEWGVEVETLHVKYPKTLDFSEICQGFNPSY